MDEINLSWGQKKKIEHHVKSLLVQVKHEQIQDYITGWHLILRQCIEENLMPIDFILESFCSHVRISQI